MIHWRNWDFHLRMNSRVRADFVYRDWNDNGKSAGDV